MELTLEDLKDKNIPVTEKQFVSVGGGIGSFCWVDALRIHGVGKEKIAVITKNTSPYFQLKTYCDNIGLTSDERFRSDSGSRPDNFWGFPGYALSEICDEVKSAHNTNALRILWQIFTEPLLSDYYSPKTGRVYKSIDNEVERIGWEAMLKSGEAHVLRKLKDGRFAVIYKTEGNRKTKAIVGNVIHLSLGHNRKNINRGENTHSAYEPNKSIFKKIEKNGGKVAVVGRGSSAARVVERLIELRQKGVNLKIVSVFKDNPKKSFNGWRLQQFNWPHSAFGGKLANKVTGYGGDYKKEIFRTFSAPSAVPKRKWLRDIKKALTDGYYTIFVNPKANVKADYIIDATGFDDRVINNPFYEDMQKNYNLPLSFSGGFKTDESFRIDGLYSESGAVFVSGIGASGNYYGPVDSFFGQQYVALKSIDLLSSIEWVGIEKLFFLNSLMDWIKWLLNKKI